MKGRNIKTEKELGGHCLHWLAISMVNTSKLYPVPCGKEKKEKTLRKRKKSICFLLWPSSSIDFSGTLDGENIFSTCPQKAKKNTNIISISIAKKEMQNKLPIHSPSTWSGHVTCISVEKSTPEPSTPASSSSWSSVCCAKSWPVCSFGINLEKKKKKRLILILFI